MSTTGDQSNATGRVGGTEQDRAPEGRTTPTAGAGNSGRQSGWTRAAKRYGPFVVVAAVIATVVAIVGGGDDGDGDAVAPAGDEVSTDLEDLILSGPMTPQRAELEGETDVDFGPSCDIERGVIMLPIVYTPPCVEPFVGDNGGATYQGVTDDEVLVVMYQPDPALDPLQSSILEGAGADVNPETTAEAMANFAELYNELFETYGRTVRLEFFTGTGGFDDVVAARADAVAIAEMEPFAVIGGPLAAVPVFAGEIAARDIVWTGWAAHTVPDVIVEEHYPHIWTIGPTPNQAGTLGAEMIGKLAGPGPAELSGDPEKQERERVYALVHYDTPDGDFQGLFETLTSELAENGIELETDIEFFLDLERAQENARTIISRLKAAGVTTIIYTGDPFTPGSLTEEATAQDYYPEWILGPSVYMDLTIFARLTDDAQWQNGFGQATPSARGTQETNNAFHIYQWAFGEGSPNNTVNNSEPGIRGVFNGIHMAGHELTPETFRDGLYRLPPSGGGPTNAQFSRGYHDFWPDEDLGGSDDMSLIWWDPEASGEDETGNEGVGIYRYAHGGQRYTLGELPETFEEAGLFDDESSVTIYEELPPEDQVPDYPPPGGG